MTEQQTTSDTRLSCLTLEGFVNLIRTYKERYPKAAQEARILEIAKTFLASKIKVQKQSFVEAVRARVKTKVPFENLLSMDFSFRLSWCVENR